MLEFHKEIIPFLLKLIAGSFCKIIEFLGQFQLFFLWIVLKRDLYLRIKKTSPFGIIIWLYFGISLWLINRIFEFRKCLWSQKLIYRISNHFMILKTDFKETYAINESVNQKRKQRKTIWNSNEELLDIKRGKIESTIVLNVIKAGWARL